MVKLVSFFRESLFVMKLSLQTRKFIVVIVYPEWFSFAFCLYFKVVLETICMKTVYTIKIVDNIFPLGRPSIICRVRVDRPTVLFRKIPTRGSGKIVGFFSDGQLIFIAVVELIIMQLNC